jgi:uncharacterized protein (DUF2147 family)
MGTRLRQASGTVTWTLACCLAAALVLLVAPHPAGAAPTSPVGRWKTVDDATKKPKSIVDIYEQGGKLYGKIIKLFREPGEEADPKCDKCKGAKKDQRVIGMVILEGLTKDGDEWKGGTITDPANGKTYRCKIALENGKLKVRGFVGVSLLGRTQYWHQAQ